MNIQTRLDIEKRIASMVVRDAIAASYSVTVFDGEMHTVIKSRIARQVIDALMTTDEDVLKIYDHMGTYIGMVYFVYGNDGFDVICDYSVSLETLLIGANALALQLEEQYS
jgi:hypothetical protein